MMKLEICIDSLESFDNAVSAGADRVEICSALIADGLTPDIGLVSYICQNKDIEKFVMLRPRDGDFTYDKNEIEQIKEEIKAFKKYDIDGFVFGAIKEDGSLDLDLIREIVEIAKPFPVVLHRAFDYSSDGEKVIDQLIDMGILRILTSGKELSANEGLDLIGQIQDQYGNKVEIMAGSGVSAENIKEIYEKTKIKNFHMSGRIKKETNVTYKSDLELPSSGKFITSFEKVKKARNVLDELGD